jgi:hypothetical protein
MSETEEDRAYYAAVEAAFIRRRGTPFLLSPRDFSLLKEWRALGVPLEAIEAGIDEAFSRREERSAVGRVNSLSYCRDAVLEAWERRMETARGRGAAAAPDDPDARRILVELARRLAEAGARRPDLGDPLEGAVRAIARMGASEKTGAEIEASLARLDKRLAKELAEALSAPERESLDAEVARLLEAAGAGGRMDEAALEKTRRALTRRIVRERLALPRLSLL